MPDVPARYPASHPFTWFPLSGQRHARPANNAGMRRAGLWGLGVDELLEVT